MLLNPHLPATIPSLTSIQDDVRYEEDPQRVVLEEFTQCSKSHLWRLMMSFYDRKGPESWSQGIVPHFITCNTFIANAYAKVAHCFCVYKYWRIHYYI
ncbi:hypothetical protein EON64_19500 [archaeon]|nr:MAG: hypothetical protein EON64_19500 [archaeon]